MIRLQGKDFHNIKQGLRFVSYEESKNGHIRVNLKHKEDRKPKYYHWLNPEGEIKFKVSTFYNNDEYKDTDKWIRR